MKLGKDTYISTGADGTYSSTKVFGIRVSQFKPNKPKEESVEYKPKYKKPKDLSGTVNELGETYPEFKQRRLAEYRLANPEPIKTSWGVWEWIGIVGIIMCSIKLISWIYG
jgi:hypothetical protein